MSCCGKKRLDFNYPPDLTNNELRKDFVEEKRSITFQYTGNSGLTAFGAITGTKYRFDSPNATIEIDRRDASSMMAVPNLKKVAK